MSQTTKASRYQRGFEAEKAAFEKLHEALRQRYDDVFVAVHQGEVVDSAADLQALASRFFERYGDASVYMGYVGRGQPVRRIPSPSVHR